jgi:hypothetical protein
MESVVAVAAVEEGWDYFTVRVRRAKNGEVVGMVETHNNGAFDLDWLEQVASEATAAYSRRKELKSDSV